jgi:hypothetical protein
MHSDDAFTQIEPHTKSYCSFTPYSILIEYFLYIYTIESYSIILYSDFDSISYLESRYRYDWSIILSKFDRIVQEIGDDLLYLDLINFDEPYRCIYIGYDLYMWMRISEEIDFMREELLELYLFEKETHRMCIVN